MNTLHYFGTSLTDYGHYFWDLSAERMVKSDLSTKSVPFDVYEGQRIRTKGLLVYKQIGGYSAFIIGGSCKDDRNGTVSTFFVKEILTYAQLKQQVLNNPLAQKIIAQMPFKIMWENV